MWHRKLQVMKINHYITDKTKTRFKDQALFVKEKMCHTHYEEQDLERCSFMVEALR